MLLVLTLLVQLQVQLVLRVALAMLRMLHREQLPVWLLALLLSQGGGWGVPCPPT